MRYTKLFGKTQKEIPTGSDLASFKFLIQAGFIAESVAGRYYFLPLGWKVHQKIQAIIKKHMDRTGAQELITPTLHPLELWEETNRTATAGFELMQVTDRRGAEFALGGTAEEMITDLVRKYQISYKDLPFNIYQFSNKFRDEMRARGGLLRVREFVMKDAYSFHTDAKDFEKEYKLMSETYTKIFNDLELKTQIVLADGGYIGGEYCHEFQVEHETGEGTYFVSEDGKYIAHEDVAVFAHTQQNPDEEIKDFITADLPVEVCTMEDLTAHFNMPKWRFLKNVVYRNATTKEFVIVTIRGDLDVNKTKLENELNLVGQLESATTEDLAELGTKPGFVHSWGLDATYIGDLSLQTVNNFYGGFKTDTTDPQNVNYGRDFECEKIIDVAVAYDGAPTAEHGKLIEKRGIEVGNIFQLGYHYSSKMKGATFVDPAGKGQPYYMGCYGIGLGRTMATIIEKHHDQNGMIWPKSVTPYQVYLAPIGKSPEAYAKADELYQQLLDADIEVLYDDRNDKKTGPGQKFKNHELIGIPLRIVISEKTLEQNAVEVVERVNLSEKNMISIEKTIDTIKQFYS